MGFVATAVVRGVDIRCQTARSQWADSKEPDQNNGNERCHNRPHIDMGRVIESVFTHNSVKHASNGQADGFSDP
jgi:hypothetical protein